VLSVGKSVLQRLDVVALRFTDGFLHRARHGGLDLGGFGV